MTDFTNIAAAAHDPFPQLLAELQLEFGHAADAHLAREIVALEELDFLWDARVAARCLGAVERFETSAGMLHLWQLIGCLEGRWYVAKALVDADGRACDLVEVLRFRDAWDAYGAFG